MERPRGRRRGHLRLHADDSGSGAVLLPREGRDEGQLVYKVRFDQVDDHVFTHPQRRQEHQEAAE